MRTGSRWMRWTAVVIGVPAVAFWLWFGIASAYGEGLGAFNWVAHLMVPGGVLAGLWVVAWRRPVVGGALLALAGFVVLVGYPLMVRGRFPVGTVLFVLGTMALPPLVSGVLFLADWHRRRGGMTPVAPTT